MNEERFNRRLNKRWRREHRGGSSVMTGLFFLVIGGLLLAERSGVLFPEWFFSWPMILITVGLFLGFRHGFRGGSWFVMIVIGGIFLADKISDDLYLRPYFWPILFIIAGIYIILKPKGYSCKKNRDAEGNIISNDSSQSPYMGESNSTDWSSTPGDGSDIIDITAIFSGVKKNVLSKNFKGGDMVAIMGGAEINLTKADFNGRIVIDCFTMFGGTKLIVPPDWDVQSQVVAIFGGVDDKRPPSAQHDPTKIVLLEGTCIFGGIEIRSF